MRARILFMSRLVASSRQVCFSSAQITPKLTPSNVQQRTDNRACYGMNSAKPREACSAKEMREHGFRLVVGSVRHHDRPQAPDSASERK